MSKFECYITFYSGTNRALEEFEKTLKPLAKMAERFKTINVVFCQEELAGVIEKLGEYFNGTGICFNPRFRRVREGVLLPISTYHLIQEEGNPEDYIYYSESDHILQVENNFWEPVLFEVQRGNVVMPHRIGKYPIWFKGREYLQWQDYHLGNYRKADYKKHSDLFDSVTGDYSAYCGSHFCLRSVVQKHKLSIPWSTNRAWLGMTVYANRFSRKRLFPGVAPYGLLLEAPSLVFESNGQTVLKPKRIGDLHVIHLSKSCQI